MMPMCIGDATFQESAAEKPQEPAPKTALAAPRGIVPTELSWLRNVRVSSQTRRTRVLTASGETAEPVTRWSVNATTAIVKARVRHSDGKSSNYLVVRPREIDRTPLGQDGITRPLRHARIRCEGSCGVLRQAPSEKEALGFAVGKLCWGHALQEMSGAPTANSSREQIPPQLHWNGVDKIGACISL